MFNFFKKSTKSDFIMESIEEQRIPYACHYDERTLLTKNGELMQVIKIEGLSKELNQFDKDLDLRTIIRKSIIDNVKDRKVAIWFHTIRRKRNLDSVNYFSWVFARDTHDGWAKKNYWRDKFVNELYVTILYEGSDYHSNFVLAMIPRILKARHLKKLAVNIKALDSLVDKMLDILKIYGAKRLAINHDHLGPHSEILEFLSKIICLRTKRVSMPIMGLDEIFCQSKIAFGGNILEVIDEHEKHYAAVFTIKEYHDLSAEALDKLLRTSSESVITQTLTFVDSKKAKKSFEHLNYILSVSKDETLRKHCGLTNTMESDHQNPTDYATQQMSFMVMGTSVKELKNAIINVMKEVHKLGIVMVREDLHIALGFWSQLPGNFNFFRKSSYINTSRTAGFASLHNTPSGNTNNIWGSALTIFRRENGAPHFFNLHVDKVGHTMVCGITASAKETLVNFLLSESTKYDPNIFYIDQEETSRVTIKALGGKHEIISFENEKPAFSLNPFGIKDTPENHIFLKRWVLLLLFPDKDYNKSQEEIILNALKTLFTQKNRQLSSLLKLIQDDEIKEKLSLWCKPNKLGLLFDNKLDDLDSGLKTLGIDIHTLLEKNYIHAITPFMSYCLFKYSQQLDGIPTIIVFNDANKLLEKSVI